VVRFEHLERHEPADEKETSYRKGNSKANNYDA
jgi:hypothetical protein